MCSSAVNNQYIIKKTMLNLFIFIGTLILNTYDELQ